MLISDNSYQIFNFDNQKIRTHLENNKVYFCATDICNILEYKNSRKAVDDHCKEDGVTIGYIIDSLGRERSATFISEPNLYRLIFKSKMPKAVKFESFVMEEVLPKIRKTGKYEIQKNEIQLPANYIEALEALVESKKNEQKLLMENEEKQSKLDFQDKTIDKITNEKDLYGLREVAKKIQINERVLIGKLYQMGWIYTLANKQTASSKACTGGYMKNINVFSKTNDKYYIQAQITEKGLNYLIKNNS